MRGGCFVDSGRIVDHYSLKFLFIIISSFTLTVIHILCNNSLKQITTKQTFTLYNLLLVGDVKQTNCQTIRSNNKGTENSLRSSFHNKRQYML